MSLYEKCSDSQLKEAVQFIIDNKNYMANNFTEMVKNIIQFKTKLSDKQRNVLINHLVVNEKII